MSENGDLTKRAQISVGDRVVVPEPKKDDAWQFGSFTARVASIRENGNFLVEDQDADVWEVEPDRLALAEPE